MTDLTAISSSAFSDPAHPSHQLILLVGPPPCFRRAPAAALAHHSLESPARRFVPAFRSFLSNRAGRVRRCDEKIRLKTIEAEWLARTAIRGETVCLGLQDLIPLRDQSREMRNTVTITAANTYVRVRAHSSQGTRRVPLTC